MFYTYAAKFDVMKNLKEFAKLFRKSLKLDTAVWRRVPPQSTPHVLFEFPR